jgi:hypothetical protein
VQILSDLATNCRFCADPFFLAGPADDREINDGRAVQIAIIPARTAQEHTMNGAESTGVRGEGSPAVGGLWVSAILPAKMI